MELPAEELLLELVVTDVDVDLQPSLYQQEIKMFLALNLGVHAPVPPFALVND